MKPAKPRIVRENADFRKSPEWMRIVIAAVRLYESGDHDKVKTHLNDTYGVGRCTYVSPEYHSKLANELEAMLAERAHRDA